MKSVHLPAVCGLAASVAASAQSVTYSVVLSASGPVSNGDTVQVTVRCVWQDPAGVGFEAGSFRLRLDGVAPVDLPWPYSGGYYQEPSGSYVGVPPERLSPPAGSVADRWTRGRRPAAAYLADASDPNSLQRGGGFRFPIDGYGPTDPYFFIEQRTGATYLTMRQTGGSDIGIQHVQLPQVYQADPLFFETASSFDIFKFQIRAPMSGTGTVTITPEAVAESFSGMGAFIFTSADGHADEVPLSQVSVIPASFTYTPAPAALGPLVFVLAAFTRRRTRSCP